jgi:hypothetical protein
MPDSTNDTARHAIKAAQIRGFAVIVVLPSLDPARCSPDPKPEARNPKEGRNPKPEDE